MSQLYSLENINARLDLATKGLSSEKIASFFGDTLKTLSTRASLALNKVTLLAILKRVLYQSSEKYPLLAKLKVESTGISSEQFIEQFSQVDPKELTDAFRFLVNELITILREMTGDILPSTLEEMNSVEFKEQIRSSERIEHLFEISKIFAGFDTIEKTFPEVFMILGNSLAFQSILLIEKKNGECITSVWHNANISEAEIRRAFDSSRLFYEYLVSPLSHHEVETYESVTKYVLPRCTLEKDDSTEVKNKYITMPLTLSTLQTFGVLQFETLEVLNEEDLRFLTAVSNLLAITLDRFNKEQEAQKIRELKENQRNIELVHAHEYVKDMEKERDLREQFVAILTHDLRTPLTAAKMSAQLILKRPEQAEKNIVLAGKVVASIDRLDHMIRDLLDANRIRAGESLAMAMSACDMRAIAADTLRELSVTYGDRFMLESDRGEINGFWNPDGIRRVLENLVNNALKYGCPDRRITLRLEQDENYVKIIVHNFGNPIPVKDQESLFLPFHRSTSAISGEKKGWGLGLTLVRGVAEAHGGHVQVHSTEDDGTSFTVIIPKDSRPFQVLQ